MVPLVTLFGPQQVGKTTAAASLVDHYDFAHVSFADPVYRMLGALLGLNLEEVKRLPKNEPMEALEGKTLREALQSLGTEWGRELIGPDLWLKLQALFSRFFQIFT